MSINQTAIAAIRKIWEGMTFHRAKHTVLTPEMILNGRDHEGFTFMSGDLEYSTGHGPYVSDRKILNEWLRDMLQGKLSPYKELSFHNFYGFTEDGVFYHQDDHAHLDLDHHHTFTYSNFGNESTWKPPAVGQILCGTMKETPKGKRFEKWFMLNEAEYNFMQLLLSGNPENLTIEQVGRLTVTEGYPDRLFAILLLVLFDDISWFLDRKSHPCEGHKYGASQFNGGKHTISHKGLWLASNHHEFLHQVSWRLGADWWQRYKAETTSEIREHHAFGGWCLACEAEDDGRHEEFVLPHAC